MLNHYCPGSASLRRDITLTIKTCPQCGADVELFSIDFKVNCEQCGFVVYRDAQSCIQWCALGRECVGEEAYERFIAASGKPAA